MISTDQLARHPGRPWRILPETVASNVVQHYLELDEAELMQSVYVIPMICGIALQN